MADLANEFPVGCKGGGESRSTHGSGPAPAACGQPVPDETDWPGASLGNSDTMAFTVLLCTVKHS